MAAVTSTVLRLRNFSIPLTVSCDAWSRSNKIQPILISIKLALSAIPAATHTDEVEDTFSYSDIHSALQKLKDQRFENFRAIEEAIIQSAVNACWPSAPLEVTITAPDAILRADAGLTYTGTLSSVPSGHWLHETQLWSINALRVACIIGVNPHERRQKQDVVISLHLECIEYDAPESDWQYMANLVCQRVEMSEYKTVEALAAMVGTAVINIFREVKSVDVKIEKPRAYACVEGVGCSVVVQREETMSVS